MKKILEKTRELLKNKTFEEQLEIMIEMRKKYLKLEHLEWDILDVLDNGEVYYVKVKEKPIEDICFVEDDEYYVWEYQYTKEDIEKIIFRYIGHYEYNYSIKELTKWYLNNK